MKFGLMSSQKPFLTYLFGAKHLYVQGAVNRAINNTDRVTDLTKITIKWERSMLKSHRCDGYCESSSAGFYGNAEPMVAVEIAAQERGAWTET